MCEEHAVNSGGMVEKATIVADVKKARAYINKVWKVYAI